MATPPDFSAGEVLTAAQMNAVGLWLISAGSNSGANTFNHDGVFTSDYRNYRIIIDEVTVGTTNRGIQLQFRNAGSDRNTGYYYAFNGVGVGGTNRDTNSGPQTFTEIGMYFTSTNTGIGSVSIDIYNPKLVKRTIGTANAVAFETNYFARSGGFVHDSEVTNDGFRLFLSSTGNFSYNFAIYGYNQ